MRMGRTARSEREKQEGQKIRRNFLLAFPPSDLLIFLLHLGAVVACGGAARGEVTVAPTGAPSVTTAASGSMLPPPRGNAVARPRGIAGTAIRFEGGPGASVNDAIVILGAQGEEDGTAAEYKYLDMLYGPRGSGYAVRGQSLLQEKGKPYDMLDVTVAGKSLQIYFDIHDYFGKM